MGIHYGHFANALQDSIHQCVCIETRLACGKDPTPSATPPTNNHLGLGSSSKTKNASSPPMSAIDARGHENAPSLKRDLCLPRKRRKALRRERWMCCSDIRHVAAVIKGEERKRQSSGFVVSSRVCPSSRRVCASRLAGWSGLQSCFLCF